jgi:hypothetical protein
MPYNGAEASTVVEIREAPTAKYPWGIWLTVAAGAVTIIYAISRKK